MKRILIIVFCLLASNAFSQIVTDRPDQTEGSSVVPLGALQIESGILLGFEDVGTFTSRQILAPTTLFRYGLSENFELRLVSEYGMSKVNDFKADGMTDLQIGTKIQLMQQPEKNTEIAFLTHLVTPSGTQELSGDRWGTINKLSISHELSERTGIGYNIGYDDMFDDEIDGDLTYSLALGNSVSDKVGVYIEAFGALQEMQEFALNSDAGVTYLPNNNLQFDFSFGTGITDKNNYTSVGVSWLIERK